MGIISSKQSYRTGEGTGSRWQDFLDNYLFYKVFSYKMKLYKDCAREVNWISGGGSVRVKAASGLFNLMHKEIIKLIRKRLGGNNYLREVWYLGICPSSDHWGGIAPENHHSLQFYGKDNLS